MNTTGRVKMCVLGLGILGAGVSLRAEGQEIRWNPVAASGNVICTPGTGACGETEIILSGGGVTVTLFLEVSRWDPDNDGDPTLGAYQGSLDAATLDGPGECDLVPVGAHTGMGFEGAFQGLGVCATTQCMFGVNDPGCEWDPLSACTVPSQCPVDYPLCIDRPDFVFYQLQNTPFVSTVLPDYKWGAASTDCSEDGRCDGNWGAAYQCSSGSDCGSGDCQEPHFYGGTLRVDVPDLCCPPWEVGFVDDSDFTLLRSCPGPLIPFGQDGVVPGIISMEIGSCCFSIGTPGADCIDDVCAEECSGLPGPRVFRPGVDCIGCCECSTNSDCDNGNACTDDWCDNCFCYHAPNFQVGVYCCDPATGTTVPIDDGNDCTIDDCNPYTGVVTHTFAPDGCGSCCYDIGTATPGCADVESESECDAWSAPRLYRPGLRCTTEPCPDCEVGTGPDCNDNNTADLCDILRGTSEDCNRNGIPDECDIADEESDDCNHNTVPDECDLDDATSEDCTGNEIPDECEPDCNANGFADTCDLADERSEDCQPNDVPDDCDVDPADPDGNGQVSEDCTGNGVPDECEPDCQPPGEPGYGTADCCDIKDGISLDTNGNGVPDECDPGACCYFHTPSGTFNCAEVTEKVCQDNWGQFGSVFLGIDTNCPTEGVESATHDGVVVVHVTDPAQVCGGGGGLRRAECIAGDPIDPWQTATDAVMCHRFGVGPNSPAIPAGFFGPGSDAFGSPEVQEICLEGEPLGPTAYGEFGDADTLIRRTGGSAGTGDPFDRCDLPSGSPSSVDVEVVALNLKSKVPITVTYNGGEGPEQWDVTVDLSGAPPGMALIPGGEFEMGDHHGDGEPDELPVHAVYADSFFMDIYEVTNQRYADALNWALDQGGLISVSEIGVVFNSEGTTAYTDTTSSRPSVGITWDGSTFGTTPDREDHPIISVTWYGAAAYANWRSAMEGRDPSYDFSTWECDFEANGYRMPTEAEWEYAARGGEHAPYYRYPWGDTIDGSNANYSGSGDPFDQGTTPVGYYDGTQTPSGSDMANGYGLYDIAGNVKEWCHDWYASDYYSSSPYDNPHGPASGTSRVIRDGAWNQGVSYLRTADRSDTGPHVRFLPNLGFRLALNYNPPPMGSLTATRTQCNGGTYTSELHVQPRFTFRTVDEPVEVRVLDTGLEGIPYVTLTQDDNPPWTSDVVETLGLPSDICTDFHPGIEDTSPLGECDCNGNTIRDKCDIEQGYSQDCNGNTIPDSCDLGSGSSLDCDGSNVPDECDVAIGAAQDCNANDVPDSCDIDSGFSFDVNENDVPDECDTSAPVLPPSPDDARKNRYISINPDNSVTSVALRVGLSSMRRCSGDLQVTCGIDADCALGTDPCVEHPHVGSILGWVGEPDGNAVARVVHTPVFRMWPEAMIHIGDCETVPVATYEIRATPDGVVLSDPLEIGTIQRPDGWHYGDVVGLGTGALPPLPGFTPPNRAVNVTDVQAYILTAQGLSSPSAHMTWVDLHGLGLGSPPNFVLNVSDLQRIKFGFQGQSYTITPDQEDPGDCP